MPPALNGTPTCEDLVVESDFHFPSISDTHVLRPDTQVSQGFNRTFAQVVRKDFKNNVETLKDCIEETEHESRNTTQADSLPEATTQEESLSPDEDDDSRVMTKFEHSEMYESQLQFAIKRGYTKCDLDKVISKCGVGCDENHLLQELITNTRPETECSDSWVQEPAVDTTQSDFLMEETKNQCNPGDSSTDALRHIIIDGSNVAMSHGKNVFSCRGIQIAVDWFRHRGHKEITVFVPQWRKETSRPVAPIKDQHLLLELEKEGIVVFTPSRRIKGRRVVCYDDRFILNLAAQTNGIVVSNDTFRDLLKENKEYQAVVDNRLLMYTFASDRFMPPEDPLGRHGPTLDNFLHKDIYCSQTLSVKCPYGQKCTYGNKCKYYHPERRFQCHRTVTEVLKEQASIKLQQRAAKLQEAADGTHCSKTKLMNTQSLAQGEHLSSESSYALPPAQASQNPSTETVENGHIPCKKAGKTANYLREHRKKLEEALAAASEFDRANSSQSVMFKAPEATIIHRPQHGMNDAPVITSQRPSFISKENDLVSGHLLTAMKLSDEVLKSHSFTTENQTGQAQSAGLTRPTDFEIHDSNNSSFGMSTFNAHQPSVQGCQQQYQSHFYSPFMHNNAMGKCASYPAHFQSSLPADQCHVHKTASLFGEKCWSYPMSEKEQTSNMFNEVSTCHDHHYKTATHNRALKDFTNTEHKTTWPRSISGQSFHWQCGHGTVTDRDQQISGPRSGSHDAQMLTFSCMPQPEMGSNVPDHFNTSHPPKTVSPPHAMFMGATNFSATPWNQNPERLMPSSPVQSAQHCASVHKPIAVTDPRYPLYYHLCGIFAEHRVRAVINKYPNLTDPKILSTIIMNQL